MQTYNKITKYNCITTIATNYYYAQSNNNNNNNGGNIILMVHIVFFVLIVKNKKQNTISGFLARGKIACISHFMFCLNKD